MKTHLVLIALSLLMLNNIKLCQGSTGIFGADTSLAKKCTLRFVMSGQFSSLIKDLENCMVVNGFNETQIKGYVSFIGLPVPIDQIHPHGHSLVAFSTEFTCRIGPLFYLGTGLGRSAGSSISGYQLHTFEEKGIALDVNIRQEIWCNSYVVGISTPARWFSLEMGPALYLSATKGLIEPYYYYNLDKLAYNKFKSEDYKETNYRIGFIVGGTIRMANWKKCYIDINCQYRYVGKLTIEGFFYTPTVGNADDFEFPDYTFNFSNFTLGLGFGLKF